MATKTKTSTKRVAAKAARGTPEYLKLLQRPAGATSEALRVAMNRAWGPTQYQLKPIADRLGFVLSSYQGDDGYLRYTFAQKPARKAAVAAAAKKPARKSSRKFAPVA